jgi:hypothetical protein
MTDASAMNPDDPLSRGLPQPDDADESFDLYLPFNGANEESGATHVAHMRGDRDGFFDVVAGFVGTGSDLSAPLREPTHHSLEQIRFALDGLGVARVESVEEHDR